MSRSLRIAYTLRRIVRRRLRYAAAQQQAEDQPLLALHDVESGQRRQQSTGRINKNKLRRAFNTPRTPYRGILRQRLNSAADRQQEQPTQQQNEEESPVVRRRHRRVLSPSPSPSPANRRRPNSNRQNPGSPNTEQRRKIDRSKHLKKHAQELQDTTKWRWHAEIGCWECLVCSQLLQQSDADVIANHCTS